MNKPCVFSSNYWLARAVKKCTLTRLCHFSLVTWDDQRGGRSARLLFMLLCVVILVFCVSFRAVAVPDLLAQARQQAAEYDQDGAISTLKALLRQTPEHAEARLMLGTVYLNAQRYPSAEKEISRALQLGRDDGPTRTLLIRALIGRKAYYKALRELEALSPQNNIEKASSLELQGLAREGLRQFDDAEEAFTRALEFDFQPTAALGLARISLARERYSVGLDYLQGGALDRFGAYQPQALLIRGQLRLADGQYKDALADFEQLLTLEPEHLDALLGKIKVLLVRSDFSSAQALLVQVVDSHGLQPEALFLRAVLALEQQRYFDASMDAEQVLLLAPEHFPSFYIAGAAYFHLDNLEQAVRRLSRYVGQFPQADNARLLLAATYQRLQWPQDTIAVLAPLLEQQKVEPGVLALAGTAYFQLGHLGRGEQLLERALDLMPNAQGLARQLAMTRLLAGKRETALGGLDRRGVDPQSDVLVVYGYLQQGDGARAAELVRQRLATDPNNIRYMLLSAQVNRALGQVAAERKDYERILDIDPRYVPALIGLAQISIQSREFDRADDLLVRLMALQPAHIPAHLARVQLVAEREGWSAGLEQLNKIWQRYPSSVEIASEIVDSLIALDEPQKAIDEARRFYRRHGEESQAVYLYIRTLQRVGHLSESIHALRKLIDKEPDRLSHRAYLAELHFQQGDGEAADGLLTELLAVEPDYLPALFIKARVLKAAARNEEALAVIERILAIRPGDPGALSIRGDIFFSDADYQQAVTTYLRAYPKIRGRALISNISAGYQRWQGVDAALAFLTQHLEKYPGDQSARLLRAGLYLQSNALDEAVIEYQALKNQQADNPVVWNNLADIYFEQGDIRALEYAREAHRIAPDLPQIQDTLGWILLAQGGRSEALILLKKAARSLPDNPLVRYHYAVALNENKQFQDARAELESLLNDQSLGPRAQALYESITP